MLWTLEVKGSKSMKPEMQIRVTHVVLAKLPDDGQKVKLLIKQDNDEFVLCTLDATNSSQLVDIMFTADDEICFKLSGDGLVNLIGREVPFEDDDDEDTSASSESSYDSIVAAKEDNEDHLASRLTGNRRSRMDAFRAARRN